MKKQLTREEILERLNDTNTQLANPNISWKRQKDLDKFRARLEKELRKLEVSK